MHVLAKEQEQLTNLLNEWYLTIRSRNINDAVAFSEKINLFIQGKSISNDVSLYYELVKFRYNVLVNRFEVSDTSFDNIDKFSIPNHGKLTYFYYFFKAIYYTMISNYEKADKFYSIAYSKLENCSNDQEIAEFHYMYGSMLYHSFQPGLSIHHLQLAYEIFSKANHTQLNIAFCNNLFGLCWSLLKKYDRAEKCYTIALEIFHAVNEDGHILMTKHNLGLMYSDKGESQLAIEYLSDVNKKNLNHFKALFIEAREHFKLHQYVDASERIERGLNICLSVGNKEYFYHFQNLKALIDNVSVENLEAIFQESIRYFIARKLFHYTLEYQEILAHKYLKINNFKKSCEFFLCASNTRNLIQKEGELS
ncbi:hypothetical protein [Bacillus thuringiensis]|uniref:response regulator aspartate phosphatase n=1 Tax=Bacillus thuringiensis TaxID=1428 RepID=UPI0011A8D4EE|nr:hypothetical protein [Bacillus thuringiensis]